jgi:hypothetical protein
VVAGPVRPVITRPSHCRHNRRFGGIGKDQTMPTKPESVSPPTVQAETLNWMLDQITRLNDLTVEGAEYEQVPGGRQLRIPKPPVGFWARVRKAEGPCGYYAGGGSGRLRIGTRGRHRAGYSGVVFPARRRRRRRRQWRQR